jgi:hypothetical protein
MLEWKEKALLSTSTKYYEWFRLFQHEETGAEEQVVPFHYIIGDRKSGYTRNEGFDLASESDRLHSWLHSQFHGWVFREIRGCRGAICSVRSKEVYFSGAAAKTKKVRRI